MNPGRADVLVAMQSLVRDLGLDPNRVTLDPFPALEVTGDTGRATLTLSVVLTRDEVSDFIGRIS